MVVFSHSFALVGLPQPSIGGRSFGELGVWIFFILSGFLISASWTQYPRFNVFFAKRALRIFPGLMVAVVLSIIVCGLFYTNFSPLQFFASQETLNYLNNILLINTQYTLPGDVFANNPSPFAVNGSIWTLAYEFLMYIAVALIGALGLYRKMAAEKIWATLAIIQLTISLIGYQHFDFSIFYFQFNYLVMFGLMFFTGVLVQRRADFFSFTPKYGLITFVAFVLIATYLQPLTEIAAATLLAYTVFSLGSSEFMSWFGRYGDFSYGIYIYSFPIQQMVVSSTQTSNPYKLFVLSWALSVAMGALSWWVIESRALKLKTKIRTDKYPVLQTETVW